MSDAHNEEMNEQTEVEDIVVDTNTDVLKKRSRKTNSFVWDNVTRMGIVNGREECKCNYCGKSLSCASKLGITRIKRHLEDTCPYYNKKGKGQQILKFTTSEQGSTITTCKFDQEQSRDDLTRWFISSELSFRIIENPSFHAFLGNLQPKFKVMSRFTLKRDCMKLYEQEKIKLMEVLKNSIQRVCITIDMWTSLQNLGYMSITAHYIDSQWKLNKKILSFCLLSSRHTGDNIADMIVNRLSEWNIEKLCTITMDNASTNDVVARNLIEHYASRDCILLNGNFFHVRCWAHILNLVVQDGLSEINDTITKIRNLVKYVKYSTRRFQEFKELAKLENVPITKGLSLDVSSRWNSTFLMLQSALTYQKVFTRLKARDCQSVDIPSFNEWKKVEYICGILEIFYNATKVFSGKKYSTSNLFFSLIFEIGKELQMLQNSDDCSIKSMASKMQVKFDKYWSDRDCMMPLVIATVLDPRYKFEFLRFSYSELYSEVDVIEIVTHVQLIFSRLFEQYASVYKISKCAQSSTSYVREQENTSTLKKKEDIKSKWKKQKKEMSYFDNGKSEVDLYLEDTSADDVEDEDFDVMKWWEVNASKYRILSHLARDVLAIPVSIVASESAFSTGGRVVDQYRSNLNPATFEALVCTQDWLRDEGCTSIDAEYNEGDEEENEGEQG